MANYNQAMGDLLRYNSAILPQKRSAFNKSHSHTTTFDSGYLIPLMWDRVLPGDEKKIKYNGLCRMATPIHPVMDEANLDVWAFYVPDRLWWKHAKEFYGENLDAEFNPDGEYVMPSLPVQWWAVDPDHTGTLSDYFGFPVAPVEDPAFLDQIRADGLEDNFRVTAGLHRSYQLIWNEWFRNSSIQPALRLNDGDQVYSDEWAVISQLRKANKLPDYFTTLLREPQAGDAVMLPLGSYAPVVTGSDIPLETFLNDSSAINFEYKNESMYDTLPRGYFVSDGMHNFGVMQDSNVTINVGSNIAPRNLWADLSSMATATINDIRAAVTVQHLLELDSIAGKRYQQILQAHFGVFTPDATLQRPELLGATREKIGMRQVVQTSETSGESPLGNTAAFSLTQITNQWICNKSFTEPGFIMVIGCVRPVVSYSQSLDPLLTKLQRYDHYWPVFDNLGNQPLKSYYVNFPDHQYDLEGVQNVFGYQEAWTEYRIKQNRVSGLMRPNVNGTLSSWNYAVTFERTPYLNSEFIEVDPNVVDRTIATPGEPQFICDSYFDYIDIKNMSVHSIPGLQRL